MFETSQEPQIKVEQNQKFLKFTIFILVTNYVEFVFKGVAWTLKLIKIYYLEFLTSK